jgi:hypothetical protein
MGSSEPEPGLPPLPASSSANQGPGTQRPVSAIAEVDRTQLVLCITHARTLEPCSRRTRIGPHPVMHRALPALRRGTWPDTARSRPLPKTLAKRHDPFPPCRSLQETTSSLGGANRAAQRPKTAAGPLLKLIGNNWSYLSRAIGCPTTICPTPAPGCPTRLHPIVVAELRLVSGGIASQRGGAPSGGRGSRNVLRADTVTATPQSAGGARQAAAARHAAAASGAPPAASCDANTSRRCSSCSGPRTTETRSTNPWRGCVGKLCRGRIPHSRSWIHRPLPPSLFSLFLLF